MGTLDDLVRRATAALRDDREVQLDVAHELHTHLEEAVAENRSRGMDEREAVKAAERAFGDAEEVGRELLRANRRRMRLRALVRRAARVTLVPALLLALALFLLRSTEAVLTVQATLGHSPLWIATLGHSPLWIPRLGDDGFSRWALKRALRPRLRSDLTDEERRIYYEGESLPPGGSRSVMESARARLALRPRDPVLYAHYCVVLLSVERWRNGGAPLKEMLAILDKGEEIEPENAFYNYMKAAVMMERGAEVLDDDKHTYVHVSPDGKRTRQRALRLEIKDPVLVRRAVEEVRRGNAKPSYSNHQHDYADLCLGMLRTPKTLGEELYRIAFTRGLRLPDLTLMRHLGLALMGYAHHLARAGEAEEAARVVDVAQQPPLMMGASAEFIITFLVADSCFEATCGKGALVLAELGQNRRAAALRERHDQHTKVFAKVHTQRRKSHLYDRWREVGYLLGSMISPYHQAEAALQRHWRGVERTVFERFAFTGLLLLSLVFLVAMGAAVVVQWLRCRKEESRPVLLFVGWRRLGGMAALSIGLPLAGYILWTRILRPWGDPAVVGTPLRFAAEILALAVTVFVAAGFLAHRAIRRRCSEVGLPTPRDPFLTWLWPTAMVAAAQVLLVGAWAIFSRGHPPGRRGDAIALLGMGAVTLFAVINQVVWAASHLRHGSDAHYRGTMIRSFLPVFACVLLLSAGVAHGLLSVAEAHHVRAIHRMGDPLRCEMEPFEGYRRYFQSELERFRAADAAPERKAPQEEGEMQ